jgi:hypothetical protein
LKAVHHISVTSVETMRASNMGLGFDRVKPAAPYLAAAVHGGQQRLGVAAQLEIESKV